MTQNANWSFPTNIRFGPGRIQELADACRETGMQRPMLVTDRGLANLDITARALRVLELRGTLGVPDRLSGLGVQNADVSTLATHALNDPTAGGNPVELTQEAAETLYAACL